MNLTEYNVLHSLERDAALLEDVVADLDVAWRQVKGTTLTPRMLERVGYTHDRLYEAAKALQAVRTDCSELLRAASWQR